jgi:aspartyl/glutamyl-tRNA(Asn/Gln) amidotransferase C subunit
MESDDMKKLAILARIDMDKEEMLEIGSSFGPILDYVSQIKEVSDSMLNTEIDNINTPINVTRDDIVTNNRGEYTEKIINQMPDSENNFLKVKQIL